MFLRTFLLLTATAIAAPTPKECVQAYEHSTALTRDSHLLEARNELLVCQSDSCPADVKSECQKHLLELGSQLPSLVIEAKDSAGNDVLGATVAIDGAAPVAVGADAVSMNPGSHTFRVEAKDFKAIEKTWVLRIGDKNRHERVVLESALATSPIAPPPSTKSGPWRTIGLVTAGVGIGGLVLGAITGSIAIASWSSSKAACSSSNAVATPAECPDRGKALSEHDTAMTTGTISTVAFIAGGVLAVAGGVIFFVAPSPGGANVTVGARF